MYIELILTNEKTKMKFEKVVLNLLLMGMLFACSKNDSEKKKDTQQPIKITENVAVPNTDAKSLINRLRPKSQFFEFDASSDFTITGKKGTHLYIPRNSFIDKNGQTVTGKVKIELIEVVTVGDFVKANLQTLSNGSLLQSEGMLFIDAKSNGQTVALAKGKKIQVELPKVPNNAVASNIKIFSGTYDSTGKINWVKKATVDKRMIPLPLKLFDYKAWTSFGFVRAPNSNGYGVQENSSIEDSLTFKQPKLENTFIATREFEERFRHIMSAEWAIGHYTSFHSTTVQKGPMIRDSLISQIYLNNLDKDLWYCDSLAYSYMKTWESKADFNSYWYSEAEKFDLMAAFKRFYEQRLTTVIKYPPGIDLNNADAREQLKKSGLSEDKIDEILGAYQRQKEILTARNNRKKTRQIFTNSFSVSKLGWINCDAFYNDPNAKESSIMAQVTNLKEDELALTTLVINKLRVALNGWKSDKGTFTFTGNKAPYTKLPIGQKATIVALSYKNNKPYIGVKEFVISEKESLRVELVESSVEALNKQLESIK